MDVSVVVAARPNVPPAEELGIAALADRLGYRELWVGEGFVWDAFALATAAGLATSRVAAASRNTTAAPTLTGT